jgi:hypothetical protein
MNKNGSTQRFIQTAFLGLSVFVFSSCFLTNNTDDDTITAPTVAVPKNSTTVIEISFAPQTNMIYANVFRQASDTENFSTVQETLNIGQVVPENTSSLPSSFIFNDEYTSSTATYPYYRYYVRFCSNTSYYSYSEKSDVIEGTTGTSLAQLSAASSADLTTAGTYTFTYTKNTVDTKYTLTLNTPVTVPSLLFTPLDVAFRIVSSGKAKPFVLAVPSSNIVAANSVIDLQRVLSSGFFDTKIQLTGMIGVSSEKRTQTTGTYTEYYWTTPFTDITIQQVLTEYDTDGTTPITSTSKVSSFQVPEPVTADNGMDYTASVINKKAAVLEANASNTAAVLLDLTSD